VPASMKSRTIKSLQLCVVFLPLVACAGSGAAPAAAPVEDVISRLAKPDDIIVEQCQHASIIAETRVRFMRGICLFGDNRYAFYLPAMRNLATNIRYTTLDFPYGGNSAGAIVWRNSNDHGKFISHASDPFSAPNQIRRQNFGNQYAGAGPYACCRQP